VTSLQGTLFFPLCVFFLARSLRRMFFGESDMRFVLGFHVGPLYGPIKDVQFNKNC
jgi:hypothetical protein